MIGQRLKAWRKSKSLTQQVVATKTGSSSGYISEVEQGKMMPGSSFLVSLNREFGINLHWLLTGEEDAVRKTSQDVQVEEDHELAELLAGARKVLTSGNPIAFDALERNIRYFSHAIDVEKRMAGMEAALAEMKRYVMDLKKQQEQGDTSRKEEPSSGKKAA